MISRDGKFTIFRIQHRSGTKWGFSSFDYFGTPKGMSASDECWQITGVMGTFSRERGFIGLLWIRSKWPTHKFRLVRVEIQQETIPEKEPTDGK